MGISSYSTNPASNTSISGINIAEGCPPSGINNAIRQLMADIATDVRPQQLPTATGTANAVVVALSPAVTSYAGGQSFSFLPASDNTGATTINYGGGVINLQKRSGGNIVALALGDLKTGVIAKVDHDGTRAILLNPQQYSHGADVASAATVNLDTATGDYVYITGTTGINAITLAEGKEATTKFAGALVITNSASLIAPGAANYTTAANDVIVWRGEAAGVVRAIGGLKADGSAFTVAAVQAIPAGTVAPYAGSSAPSGWLLCDGSAVSRTTYASLYGVVSTTYGVGDGVSTFNLPDLRGRAVFGKDNMGGSTASRVTATSGITGTTLGAAGGAQVVTLTTSEMPSHSHGGSTDSQGNHSHGVPSDAVGGSDVSFAGRGQNSNDGNISTTTAGAHTHNITTDAQGGGGAHQNMPPAIILNYIIKT